MLSQDAIFGNADDIPLGIFVHSGALAPDGQYTVNPTLTLPDGIAGDYYLIVDHRHHATRSTSILLEGDNVTASGGTFHVTLAPYPDLKVEGLARRAAPTRGGVYTVDLEHRQPRHGRRRAAGSRSGSRSAT